MYTHATNDWISCYFLFCTMLINVFLLSMQNVIFRIEKRRVIRLMLFLKKITKCLLLFNYVLDSGVIINAILLF